MSKFRVARADTEILTELDRSFLAHVVGEEAVDVAEAKTCFAERLLRGERDHRELVLVDHLPEGRFRGPDNVDRHARHSLHPRFSARRRTGRTILRPDTTDHWIQAKSLLI